MKFLILILTFQHVFAKSMYQKKLDKKRQEQELVRAKAEALALQEELILRDFCKIDQHYHEDKCVLLRANDDFRAYCEINYTESKCVKQFGTLHFSGSVIFIGVLILMTIFIAPIVMHCIIM